MKKYILGLDLGTGSVGWSAVLIGKDNEPYRILDLGSRIFESNPSDLESRRICRSTRRLIRRRKARLIKTRHLFAKYAYLAKDKINFTFDEKNRKFINEITIEKIGFNNIVELRLKGKKEKLSYEELYVLLINYAKHRGFKSNRKVDESAVKKDTDEGKLLLAIGNTSEELKKLKENNPEATISDYLYEYYKKDGKTRNDSFEYRFGITRAMIEEEVNIILDKQISLGLISKTFKEEYNCALFKQLLFSEGPEEGPYSDPLKKSIGTFFGEKCAPKNSYSFCVFTLAQKLLNLRYYNPTDKKIDKLTKDQINTLVDKFDKENITYNKIYSLIGNDCLIKNVDDIKKHKVNEEKRKDPFIKVKGKEFGKLYHNLAKELSEYNITDTRYYDLLAECFSTYKSDYEIENYLRGTDKEKYARSSILNDLVCSEELIEFAKNYKEASSYKQFGSVSLKFIYDVLPKMREGLDYYSARDAAGYPMTNYEPSQEMDEIPVINEILKKLEKTINNRSVIATLVEARKVVNAVISKYGKPYEVHIEMARDLTLSKKEKDEYEKVQQENFIKKQSKIYEIFDKFPERFNNDVNRITSQDLLKYDLWKEQQGMCLYTLAATGDGSQAKIPERSIFTADVEVEHIIPYSKSFDDRRCNKILVFVKENRNKGDSIPGVYYEGKKGYDAYKNKIDELYPSDKNKQKRERLLSTRIEDYLGDYHARTINDSRYAMKAFKEILEYSFPKLKVRPYVGGITAKLRALWRLNNLTSSYASPNYQLENDSKKLADLNNQIFTRCLETGKNFKDFIKEDEGKELIKNLNKEYKEGKKNRENHFHHAVDATILACATDKMRVNVERQEILYRIRADRPEDFIFNQELIDQATGEYIIDEKTGEVKIERVTLQSDKNNQLTQSDAIFSDRSSKFPVPYFHFTEELKTRALEMDADKLKKKLKEFGYEEDEIKEANPLIISHAYSSKLKGALHKATFYGKKELNKTEKLVVSTKLTNLKRSKKNDDLEKIFDKDGTQKIIYFAIKEWMGSYSNGKTAYEKNGSFPRNKNGNEIKRVKIIANDGIKEQFELKEGHGNYVQKENNVETWIFTKEGDSKLYFVGMDAYKLMNAYNPEKKLNAVLWLSQNSCVTIPFSKLYSEGYKLKRKIAVGQTIMMKMNNGKNVLCISGGITSGMFEIKSITGDFYDLIAFGLKPTAEHRVRPSVNSISDILPISLDVLGKKH